MEHDRNIAAQMRQMQEDICNVLASGYYKDVARLLHALYEEYLAVGFTKKQALELTKTVFLCVFWPNYSKRKW